MSLQHLLRRNCQLFWFLLNCVMLSSVGNCPLVTSLGPLNSNLNLAFWRWGAALIYPGTILWALSPLYFTHTSKLSRTNLHLKSIQNKGWIFVSLSSELSLTLGISSSKLWSRAPKEGSFCTSQFARNVSLRIEFHDGLARCAMFVLRKLYSTDKSRFVYHCVLPKFDSKATQSTLTVAIATFIIHISTWQSLYQ